MVPIVVILPDGKVEQIGRGQDRAVAATMARHFVSHDKHVPGDRVTLDHWFPELSGAELSVTDEGHRVVIEVKP